MPAVLFKDNQHGNIGFAWLFGVDRADDAGDRRLSEVGHDGEIRPAFDEVVIGKDWIGLCKLSPKDMSNPV